MHNREHRLPLDWPRWQIWTVPTWDGHRRGVVWCARRWSGEGFVLNAHSPAELAEYLEDEASR